MKQPKVSPYREAPDPRVCGKCRRDYVPNRAHQRFCSIQCKNDHHTAERQRAYKLMREAAAELTVPATMTVRAVGPLTINKQATE